MNKSALLNNISIYHQCRTGTVENIRQLIESSDKNELDNLFHLCAEFGHLILVKELITSDPNFIQRNPKALSNCCLNNQFHTAVYLIEQGIDVISSSHKSLEVCSIYGYIDIVSYLYSWYKNNNLTLKAHQIINEYGHESTKKWFTSKLLADDLEQKLSLKNNLLKPKI